MMLLLAVVYFILCHHFITVCPTRAFKGQENKTHLSFLSYDATLNAGHPSKCLSRILPHPPNGVWRRASHRCHFLSAVYFPARAPVRLSGHPQSRPALCPPGRRGKWPNKSSQFCVTAPALLTIPALKTVTFSVYSTWTYSMQYVISFSRAFSSPQNRMAVHSTAQLAWLHKDCITFKFSESFACPN